MVLRAGFIGGSLAALALLLSIACAPSSESPPDSAGLSSTPPSSTITQPTATAGGAIAVPTQPSAPHPVYTPRPKSTNTPIPALVPGSSVSPTAEQFAAIDSHALAAPAAAEASVESLAAYLAAPATNDAEKTRAIYRWITANISYDIKAYLAKQYGDTSAAGVLKSRTSICEGYATLFEALAKASGLDVVKVPGWAKGFGYIGTELEPQGNHAWNAVKVGGSWYLIDSTWGAGYIDDNQEFVRGYNDYFFLTPPDQFLYTHLPLASQWQLVPQPINAATFGSLPQVQPAFFEHQLSLMSHTQAKFQARGQATVTVGAPADAALLANLEQDGVRLEDKWTFVQREGGSYRIDALFPKAGTYTLAIYAKNAADPGQYASALEYEVEALEASANQYGFPETYGVYHTSGAHLEAPRTNGLPRGSTQRFKISVPKALNVVVVIGDKWKDLTKTNELFEDDVVISGSPIKVCAKLTAGDRYECLLEYEAS